ncbi:ArnT family glycosyltransferase [Glaciecola sp. SC05]|uniref:ArnT family glycosyltransferase n=1 Tax=Glaciecola sp. SC05 TaxID=1987355 RepID=UPI0035273A9E
MRTSTVTPAIYKHTNRIAELLLCSFGPLFIVAGMLIFTGMGLRDPWPADEPRFALIAKEMVETGQWLFPARAQELYPDKPPIFMWTIAIFYWLTGSIRVSFLMPSAISGLLTLFLVYDIGKRLWSKEVGLVAGWLLLFSFQFLLQAKTAQIDATVSAWMMIGCYGILRYALVDGKYRWYVLAWFFMGIGVITKGVGFLPMLMLIPLVFYRYQAKASQSPVSYSHWTWWMGPLIMLGAIGLWVIPMLIVVAQSDNTAFEMYRDNILFKQTVTRYADSWHHLKPAYYYVTSVIPVFWLPLSLAIPLLIKPWLSAFKSLDPRIILPLSWVVLVIIFFSISPGKRGVYILPALPMLVLSVAPYYQQLFSKKGLKRFLFVLVACLSMALTVFGILGLLDVAAVAKLAAKIEVTPWYFFLCIGGLSTAGLLYAFIYNKWLAWPIFFAVLWTTYSTYGYVLRNEVSTPRAIYETAKPFLSDSAEIALVDYSEQFILLSPYPMYHFGYNTPLKYQLEAAYHWQSKDNQYLIIEDKLIDQACFDMEQSIDLGFAHRRHWILLPSAAKKADCGYKQSQHPVYFYQHK